MKKILLGALVAVAMAGCEANDKGSNYREENSNGWIYNVMAANYYWAEHLPSFATSGAGQFSVPQYFENLRYRENRNVAYQEDTYGDRFSHLEIAPSITRAGMDPLTGSYGPGFFPVSVSDRETGEINFLQVLYVTPGSPADGKLKRGDIFRHINGTQVTNSNINYLLSSTPTMSIPTLNTDGTVSRTVTINCGNYFNSPIIVDSIYSDYNTAYLAYTHFVSGGRDGLQGAANEMRQAFARYKAAGVNTLILDLRYNGGGELTAAVLLASLIARNSDLGAPLTYLRDNKDTYEAVNLLTASEVAENANIEKLVVLTSNGSASASELIIHCLEPFFDDNLIMIGEKTYGKNMGGATYTNNEFGLFLSPMEFMVYNKDYVSGYETGLVPDINMREYGRYPSNDGAFLDLGALGNYENEHQLNVAMNHLFPDIPLRGFVELTSSSRSADNPVVIPLIPIRNLTDDRNM